MEGGTRVTSRETSNGQRFGACVAARGVRLGPAHVTGTALDRSVAFYGDVVGLGVHRRESAVAALGDGEGEEVLVLVEEQGAAPAVARRPVPRRPAYPSREELAHAAGRIALTRTPIEGASDHGTHEAIYSLTPTQRPRARRGPSAERWPASLGVRPRPARLEVDGLLAVIAASERRRPAEPGVAVGRLHPHVGDVEQGLPSTLDAVGFEAMVRLPSAAFVAAAIAITALTCGEVGVPAPAGVVGLRHWTVELPTSSDVAALR
jgi:catechol 2,3-dioxygenase